CRQRHPGHPRGQGSAQLHRCTAGQFELSHGARLYLRAQPRRGVRRAPRRLCEEAMSDKRTTLDEAVAQLRSGMTLGIGGWGSRRKPMAFVRAMLRTDIKDLTVVTYGGPDLGLPRSAGKVKRGHYRFVSLDSPPFYHP